MNPVLCNIRISHPSSDRCLEETVPVSYWSGVVHQVKHLVSRPEHEDLCRAGSLIRIHIDMDGLYPIGVPTGFLSRLGSGSPFVTLREFVWRSFAVRAQYAVYNAGNYVCGYVCPRIDGMYDAPVCDENAQWDALAGSDGAAAALLASCRQENGPIPDRIIVASPFCPGILGVIVPDFPLSEFVEHATESHYRFWQSERLAGVA